MGNSGYGIWWNYDWYSDLDSTPVTGGVPTYVDSGEYAGWHFVAVRVGKATGTASDSTCDYTGFVGKVDRDDFRKLGTQTAMRMRHDQWTQLDTSKILVSVSDYGVSLDTNPYDEFTIQGSFARYDELRIYNRALSDGEIEALYLHPGGQKRTENLLEPERQVTQP